MDGVDHDAALVGPPFGLRLGLAVDQDAAGGVGHGRRGDQLVEIALETSLEGLARVDRGRVDDDERLAQVRRPRSTRARPSSDVSRAISSKLVLPRRPCPTPPVAS